MSPQAAEAMTPLAGNARSYGWLAAVLAIVLIGLAWPRLRAALNHLPVDAAIERYEDAGASPLEGIEALIERAQRTSALHPHPRFPADVALLSLLQAGDPTLPLYRQREALERVVQASGESLVLAPAQPRLWAYRGLAQSSLAFKDFGAIDSFKLSVYTGRVEPTLLTARLRTAYGRLAYLDDEARGLLRDQTLLAWRLQPAEFTRAVKRGEFSLQRVGLVLEPVDAAVLLEMEAALGRPAR